MIRSPEQRVRIPPKSGLQKSRLYSRLKRSKCYIQDLVKGREWEIVQECSHRGIWDIPEVDPTTSASIPLIIELSNIDRLNHRHETAMAELVTVVEDDEEVDEEDEACTVFEGDDVDVDTNITSSDDDE